MERSSKCQLIDKSKRIHILYDHLYHRKSLRELIRDHSINYSSLRHILAQYFLFGRIEARKFKNTSYVILDGKFANLDPYEGTNNHLLSDVLNSKLEIKKSKFPTFKDSRKKYLNKGLVRTPGSTFKKVVKRCSKYFPFLENSKYVYSIYSIRTIKRENNNDDRNSEIININNKVCVVFSGKWMSCYYTANKLYKFLNS